MGHSRRYVERLISEGEGLPLIRTGKSAVGITEPDGDAWIESRRVVPLGWKDGPSAI
jgi:hypothetical protein